jgi:hypothetical protein
MSTKSKTKKKEPVYDIADGRLRVPDEPVPPVEIHVDPWYEYKDLEASRNQSDILLAILHELVKLREVNHAKG